MGKTATDIAQRFLASIASLSSPAERQHPLVWLVAPTSAGKTPIALKGLVPLGFHHIGGSQFFRASFGKTEIDYLDGRPYDSVSTEEIGALKKKFVADLSAHSLSLLKADPRCNVKNVTRRIGRANAPCVMEGFRNPYEFMRLYDPAQDMVFFVDRTGTPIYDTVFERGIPLIRQNVAWCMETGLAATGSVHDITFGKGQIDVVRHAKDGGKTQVAAEHLENADDYALIDRAAVLCRDLVKAHYPRL